MIKIFGITELQSIVEPHALPEVLQSLKDNGLLSSYRMNFEKGTVRIEIPKNVEVAELIAGFKDIPAAENKTRKDYDS